MFKYIETNIANTTALTTPTICSQSFNSVQTSELGTRNIVAIEAISIPNDNAAKLL